MTPSQPIKLYRHPLSGHSHRVQLLISMLGLPVEIIDVDVPNGAHKAPEFLARNAFGQVPVIEDDDVTLADSTAILVYLARRYDADGTWLPSEPVVAATVQRWLSVAAGELANGPAAARLVTVFGAQRDHDRAKAVAEQLLAVIDRYLADRDFFAGPAATIADLAMYSYTAHAPEGDVSLASFPNVRAWLRRVEALPGFVPMQPTAVGLAA